MNDTRTSFSYDPIRQGYDTNSWKTLSGAPAIVAGGRLVVDNQTGDVGSTVHYADVLKGEISFNVNSPTAPGADIAHIFGVASLNTTSYIRFSIAGTLTCQVANDGVTTESGTIAWDPAWTATNTVFTIRWEAGGAKFFVAGTQVFAVSNSSVPFGPLSLYLSDDSASPMSIGDMYVRGTQSFVMNPKTSDTTNYGSALAVSSAVTVTENVAMKIPTLVLPFVAGALFDGVAISENIALSIPVKFSVSDSVTVTTVFG